MLCSYHACHLPQVSRLTLPMSVLNLGGELAKAAGIKVYLKRSPMTPPLS